jgi:hypothetical protein
MTSVLDASVVDIGRARGQVACRTRLEHGSMCDFCLAGSEGFLAALRRPEL